MKFMNRDLQLPKIKKLVDVETPHHKPFIARSDEEIPENTKEISIMAFNPNPPSDDDYLFAIILNHLERLCIDVNKFPDAQGVYNRYSFQEISDKIKICLNDYEVEIAENVVKMLKDK